ncbi:MAG: DUF3343 domain-containing protein [Lachnospirales bacterium]
MEYLISFESFTMAMAGESALKNSKTIPTPPAVDKSCGLSIIFNGEINDLLEEINNKSVKYKKIYKVLVNNDGKSYLEM